jgi:hypothetical protein
MRIRLKVESDWLDDSEAELVAVDEAGRCSV